MAWMPLFFFVATFALASAAEVLWLVRRGWSGKGTAVVFVLASDLFGVLLGAIVVFAVLLISLMMVFGPAGTGSSAPESAYWAVLAVGIILPFVLLILSKRLFLTVFKITHRGHAWTYSVVSSILMLLIVFVPTALFSYLFSSVWT